MKFKLSEANNPGIYHAYHGTKADFNEFMYDFIGAHGTEHGAGLYFTSREDIAQSYGNIIIEADLIINHPLSEDEITITKDQTKRFIREYIDPKGDNYLSNHGDISSLDYETLLNKAVDGLFAWNTSDIDILTEILSYADIGYKVKFAYEAIDTVFNKDGIIYDGYDTFYGKPVTNYIVFSNSQIKNKRKHIVEGK